MTLITINHQIELNILGLPKELIKEIVRDLTLINPEYVSATRMGNSTYGIDKYINLFHFENEFMHIPRGYGPKLQQRLKTYDIDITYKDDRISLPPVEFGSKIKLRDYQEEAVHSLLRHKQGGVVAPCGAGKTMIILETMAQIKQPTLVITHTHDLLEQMRTRACEVLNISSDEIGIIGGGKFTIGKRLTIALVQTLSKVDVTKIADKFGAVFIDEAHHLPSSQFTSSCSKLKSHHMYWFSATPDRSDGLTNMIFAYGGPIVCTIDQARVPTITPELRVVETDYSKVDYSYATLITDLIQDRKRNELIVQTIAGESRGNYSLVLSDRKEHLKILKRMLRKALPDLRIEILTGDMKKDNRSNLLEQVQRKEVNILLATNLAREGLDITHLNRLFMTTPKKAGGAVIQECGRIMRPDVGKTDAIVFDFWDNKSPMLKNQFWSRREVYRKIGMDLPPKTANLVINR